MINDLITILEWMLIWENTDKGIAIIGLKYDIRPTKNKRQKSDFSFLNIKIVEVCLELIHRTKNEGIKNY